MSHENTITEKIKGKFRNIVTVVKGKQLSDKAAVDHAIKTKTLGRGFESAKLAAKFAEIRSKSFNKKRK